MNRRDLIRLLGCGILSYVLPAPSRARGGRKPNVIVILSDDAGYADFGYNGCPDIPTPRIDQLAREGVVCTQGYVTASVCCPSRAGLMTGRYQQRFGHECNGPGTPQPGYTPEQMGMETSEKTLGDVMKARGYTTMAIGKWHLGSQQQFHPLNRGFDRFYGFLGGSRSYFPLKRFNPNQALRDGDTPVSEEQRIHYMTDDLTGEALRFVRQNRNDPIFIYIAYNAVHTPVEALPEDIEKFAQIQDKKRRVYAAMTAALDRNVGKVLDLLSELDIDRETLIVFVNDNGGATNNGSDNGRLRGMKGSKFEGGIRVPFVLRWPGSLPKGTTYDRPVSTLDILPTALAAAQGEHEPAKPLDGVNLLPYLQGERMDKPHEILFWRRAKAAAVRKGPWKLIYVKENPPLLFNLDDDVSETKNLAEQYPDRVRDILGDLKTWESGLIPPKWLEGAKWERNQILKHRMEVVGRQAERKYP